MNTLNKMRRVATGSFVYPIRVKIGLGFSVVILILAFGGVFP